MIEGKCLLTKNNIAELSAVSAGVSRGVFVYELLWDNNAFYLLIHFSSDKSGKKVVSYRSVTIAVFLSCSCKGKMRYVFILGEKGLELEGENGMKVQSLGSK